MWGLKSKLTHSAHLGMSLRCMIQNQTERIGSCLYKYQISYMELWKTELNNVNIM